MTPESVLEIMQNSLQIIILAVAVILMPALAVGLLISMFQAATQINEMTLSFIPKLLVTLLTLILAGPWLMQTVVGYARRLIENIPFLIG